MAAYGPNAGFVPFTGFSPTLGVDAIVPSQAGGNVQFNGMSQGDDEISKVLFDRGNRGLRRLLLTLLQNNVGTNATENFTRIKAVQGMGDPQALGGLVAVETLAQINRNTTATDLTNVVASISRSPTVAYVADASGNAGGGKLGF